MRTALKKIIPAVHPSRRNLPVKVFLDCRRRRKDQTTKFLESCLFDLIFRSRTAGFQVEIRSKLEDNEVCLLLTQLLFV